MTTRAHVRVLAAATIGLGIAMGATPTSASAESLETIFRDANQALYAGDAESAARYYDELVTAGIDDAAVYFNQGVALVQTHAYGRAMVAFERALEVDPGMRTAERALLTVRQRLAEQQAERSGVGVLENRGSAMRELLRPLRTDWLAWTLLLSNFALFASLILRRVVRREVPHLVFGYVAPTAGTLVFVTALALAAKSHVFETGQAAIVVTDASSLREGPDPRTPVVEELREGREVRRTAEHGAYAQIATADGKTGWVLAAEIEPLAPPALRH
ncbi:MAG: hypothetical protein KC417_04070 [Myxococcales bacterium]|nr:hypothetical protein [Myxococcales bacterium]